MNSEQDYWSDEMSQIAVWLKSLDYNEYILVLKNNTYDLWEILYSLNVKDFIQIGILRGHAIRITKSLKQRQETSQIIKPTNYTLPVFNTIVNYDSHYLDDIKSNYDINQEQHYQQQQPQTSFDNGLNLNPDDDHKMNAVSVQNQLFETTSSFMFGLQQMLSNFNATLSEQTDLINAKIKQYNNGNNNNNINNMNNHNNNNNINNMNNYNNNTNNNNNNNVNNELYNPMISSINGMQQSQQIMQSKILRYFGVFNQQMNGFKHELNEKKKHGKTDIHPNEESISIVSSLSPSIRSYSVMHHQLNLINNNNQNQDDISDFNMNSEYTSFPQQRDY